MWNAQICPNAVGVERVGRPQATEQPVESTASIYTVPGSHSPVRPSKRKKPWPGFLDAHCSRFDLRI